MFKKSRTAPTSCLNPPSLRGIGHTSPDEHQYEYVLPTIEEHHHSYHHRYRYSDEELATELLDIPLKRKGGLNIG